MLYQKLALKQINRCKIANYNVYKPIPNHMLHCFNNTIVYVTYVDHYIRKHVYEYVYPFYIHIFKAYAKQVDYSMRLVR